MVSSWHPNPCFKCCVMAKYKCKRLPMPSDLRGIMILFILLQPTRTHGTTTLKNGTNFTTANNLDGINLKVRKNIVPCIILTGKTALK